MSYSQHSSSRNRGIDQRILAVAADQLGVITGPQLAELGVASSQITHRMRTGMLRRAYPAVYVVSAFPRSWEQELMAANRWVGDAVVSHRAAAHLWELDGIEQPPLEFTTDARTAPSGRRVIVHRSQWGARDLRRRKGFHTTSPERTLVDLAAVVSEASLESALESALRQRLTTLDRVRRRADERSGRGRRGCNKLRRLLDRRALDDVDTGSDLEVAWQRVIREGSFPDPVRQFKCRLPDGSEGRADFAWPEAKVAVEIDSWKWHFGRQCWVRDGEKSNELQIDGWVVLHFSKEHICGKRDYVIRTINAVLWPRLAL